MPNGGSITGRIDLSDAAETVTNTGLLRGRVLLNAGDAMPDTSAGRIFGRVQGLAGNDRLQGGAFRDQLEGGGAAGARLVFGNGPALVFVGVMTTDGLAGALKFLPDRARTRPRLQFASRL